MKVDSFVVLKKSMIKRLTRTITENTARYFEALLVLSAKVVPNALERKTMKSTKTAGVRTKKHTISILFKTVKINWLNA